MCSVRLPSEQRHDEGAADQVSGQCDESYRAQLPVTRPPALHHHRRVGRRLQRVEQGGQAGKGGGQLDSRHSAQEGKGEERGENGGEERVKRDLRIGFWFAIKPLEQTKNEGKIGQVAEQEYWRAEHGQEASEVMPPLECSQACRHWNAKTAHQKKFVDLWAR